VVLKRFLRSLWDDVKALFRGDTRVGPRLGTGRVYAKKGTPNDDPTRHKHTAQPELVVEAKVLRADGTVETFTVKGEVENG